jgi:hypothetical protein
MFIGFPYTPPTSLPTCEAFYKKGEGEVSHYLVKGKEGKEGMGKDYKNQYLMTPSPPAEGAGP